MDNRIEKAYLKALAEPTTAKTVGAAQLKAATVAMRAALPHEFDRLNDLVDESRQTTRRYGSDSFTWIEHEDFRAFDPYPGTRFPRALACVEFARVLNW